MRGLLASQSKCATTTTSWISNWTSRGKSRQVGDGVKKNDFPNMYVEGCLGVSGQVGDDLKIQSFRLKSIQATCQPVLGMPDLFRDKPSYKNMFVSELFERA